MNFHSKNDFGGRVNIKDVARMAGVSISTVSRVINRSAYVNPEISQAVEKIIAESRSVSFERRSSTVCISC